MYQLKLIILTLLTLCTIELVLSKTNYCSSNLCRGEKHIACNNNGKFGSACAANAKMIKITPKLQRRIVKKHNALRNRVANGNLKGFNGAIRMATIRWSPELAKVAAYNVKQCQMKHDKCRNTSKFSYAGQNLARNSWGGQNRAVGAVITGQIQSWFNEHKTCSMSAIRKLTNISNYGHFTVMVNEKNIAVGCAILRQKKNKQTSQLMACNYAYTNVMEHPVYRDGKTGSKCKTGKNPNFKGLCSYRENYDLKSTKL